MKSLERQLQISLAFVLLLILLGLVLIANFSTRSLMQEFVTSHLKHEASRLLESFEKTGESTVKIRWRRLDPNYNTPSSGHYYAISFAGKQGDKTVINSPSLQSETIPLVDNFKPTTLHDLPGPDNQHLIVWSKQYNKNGEIIGISIAEDMSLLMENRRYFSFLFITIGLVGFLLILLLQRFVIRRLFQHLDASRQEIKQIESGERQQLSENVPTEIYPLVKEFNHSLSLMQQRMERSRNSLGNLAHALKTPLSLLMQQLESADQPLAKKQAERIRQLTERELKRARMAGLGNTSKRFDPREELPTLISVLKQAHQKNSLNVSHSIADDVSVFGDREDMMELLGNLLDNAFKWADSEVSCTILNDEVSIDSKSEQQGSKIKITIEDDGVGGTAEELKQLTQRGIRLDESVEGHGLGLAICKDIVKLYGGSIEFDRSSSLSGLSVVITLPNKVN